MEALSQSGPGLRVAARGSPKIRGAFDAGGAACGEAVQLPIPDLPPVVGEIAFFEAAFSGPPSTMMQEAHEHAANWGAYRDPGWEAARRSRAAGVGRATPRALVQWTRDQSERLAPHLRDQARRAEDAREAYANAQTAVARSVRQAAFVRQIRQIAVALDPAEDDEQPMQRRQPLIAGRLAPRIQSGVAEALLSEASCVGGSDDLDQGLFFSLQQWPVDGPRSAAPLQCPSEA